MTTHIHIYERVPEPTGVKRVCGCGHEHKEEGPVDGERGVGQAPAQMGQAQVLETGAESGPPGRKLPVDDVQVVFWTDWDFAQNCRIVAVEAVHKPTKAKVTVAGYRSIWYHQQEALDMLAQIVQNSLPTGDS